MPTTTRSDKGCKTHGDDNSTTTSQQGQDNMTAKGSRSGQPPRITSDRPVFEPRRTAAVELRLGGDTEFRMTLVPPSIITPGDDSSHRHLQTDLLGRENYQVALVPPCNARTSIQSRRFSHRASNPDSSPHLETVNCSGTRRGGSCTITSASGCAVRHHPG